jgi:hypothetical protein
MDKDFESILDRSLEPDLKVLLGQFSTVVDNLVDFGAKIFWWDISLKGGDEKITGNMFFRNYLETLDAISILVKYSSVEPCNALLRILLETGMQIEYLVEKDEEQRSLCFIIWNSKENQKWIDKCDGSSPRFQELVKKYSEDKILKGTTPPVLPNVVALRKIAESMYMLPRYKAIVEEYDRTIQSGYKNPIWYGLFNGPRTLDALSKIVKMEAFYEVLYRSWSKGSHGQNIIQGKLSAGPETGDGTSQGMVEGLRSPRNAQQVTSYCMHLSIDMFRTFVAKRIPGKIPEFNEWYLSVRETYNTLSTTNLINVID